MANIEIPGFEIIEKIGAGGMATVWKARQVSLNRLVAIKILYSKFASDPADIQRFQNEAQAAARLKHPAIVQVYDANALEGLYYFIMEYIAGYTVADWLNRKGALPVSDALLVAECVADALMYGWNEARMIHCDVKPDNILVDADGTVKISDLGLARTLSHMMEDAASDDIMGTPAYIAPEQAMGELDLDFRVDIYALGATLYHMVTGRVPFGVRTADEVLELQVRGTLDDPCDVNPEVPPQVAWLIEKMMCKDPAGRQDSWETVIKDIQRVKKGLRPLGETLPEGVSTVSRSAHRARGSSQAVAYVQQARPTLAKQLAPLLALVAVAGGGYWLFNEARHGRFDPWLSRYGVTLNANPAPVEAATPAEAPGAGWETEYSQALAWLAANPTRYDEGAAMLARIAEGAAGTPIAAQARARAEALRGEQQQQQIAGALDRLAQAADPLAAAGEYEAAATVYASYAGAWQAETAAERGRRAEALRQQARDAVPAPVRPLPTVLDETVAAVLAGRLMEASNTVSAALSDPGLAPNRTELEALRDELEGAAAAHARILDSFQRQIGKQITIQMRSEARTVKVRDVRDGRVVVSVVDETGSGAAQATVEFDVQSLKYPERLRRLGGTEFAGAGIYLGLMALEAGSGESARRYFATASPLVAERLQAAVPTGR